MTDNPTHPGGARDRTAEIISDAEIIRVHGHANFGDISPREVVNEGVRKYAVGYHSGHTQLCILLEHGLITKPRPGSYDANLTKKGKRYARAMGWPNLSTPAGADKVRVAVEATPANPRSDAAVLTWPEHAALFEDALSEARTDLKAPVPGSGGIDRDRVDDEVADRVGLAILEAHGQFEIENRNRPFGSQDREPWSGPHCRLLGHAAILALQGGE